MNAEVQINSDKPNLRRWQTISLCVGVLALLACVVGWFFEPLQVFRSYLLAFVFWTGLAVGCLGVLMMQYVTGGRWGLILRRSLLAAGLTLPVLALMMVPILFNLSSLYVWTDRGLMAADEILRKKSDYLNAPFFIVRQAAYFAIWIGFAFLLDKWERKRQLTEEARYTWRLEHLSAPGMFLLAVTISLALIDWVMSLEPHWYSTIYAVTFMTGELLAGLAFTIFVVITLSPNLREAVEPRRYRDLGNLLLAFVMLWAYCSFSQYLLIWSGNLREEIPWYLPRVSGGWQYVAISLIVLHFFLPFFLLLSRGLKENTKTLLAIAMILFLLRWVDIYWLVAPAFYPQAITFSWLDLAATIGLGGIWISCFLWLFERQTGIALEKLNDERGEEH